MSTKLKELGISDPDDTPFDDQLRLLAMMRAMEIEAMKSGDHEHAGLHNKEYAKLAGILVAEAVENRQFKQIDQIAEVLRSPHEHLGPARDPSAFLNVGNALAKFVREQGRKPKSQAELIDYAELPQSTVSEALRWLGFPLKGRAGRKRNK